MKTALVIGALSLVALAGAVVAEETKPAGHVVVAAADVRWGEAPPALPRGAQLVVLAGDPGQALPFVLRLKLPAGYTIAPHWHPTAENVTVLSGTFAVGMGEKYDEAALKSLPAGSYAQMPAEMRHFAKARTAAVVQVHGTGPFALNYVNPADDPRQKAE